MLAGGGQNTSGTIRTYAESSLPWYFDLSELSVRHPTQIPTLSGWESLGTQKCVGPKNATYSCSGRSMMPVASSSHHRTPTFDLHAVRSRVYKSCAEMDSRREFRVGISPKTKWYRLEEVVCTWITCTWRLNLLLHILQVPCVKGFISRSFYSLVRAAFYSSRRPSRMRRPHIIVMYSGAAVNKETIKPKYWQRHARVRERYPLSPWV